MHDHCARAVGLLATAGSAAAGAPNGSSVRLARSANLRREERPGARHTFEFVFAAAVVGDVGSCGEVDNRSRHEDFARSGECRTRLAIWTAIPATSEPRSSIPRWPGVPRSDTPPELVGVVQFGTHTKAASRGSHLVTFDPRPEPEIEDDAQAEAQDVLGETSEFVVELLPGRRVQGAGAEGDEPLIRHGHPHSTRSRRCRHSSCCS